MVEKDLFWPQQKIIGDYWDRVTTTKTAAWSKEEEVRVVVAKKNGIVEDEAIQFHRDELHSLTFGLNTPQEHAEELTWIALQINPNVKIFRTTKVPFKNELERTPVSVNITN